MKDKILIFTNYYLPGYKAGGPIRSIANIVNALSDTFDFYIVTRDRDSFEKEAYPNINIDAWNKVGLAHVYYASDNLNYKTISFLLQERNYKMMYLNSFFSSKFSVLPLIVNKRLSSKNKLKVLIAPRGEFSKGALNLKSTKKKLFIQVTSLLRLYKDVRWQASSEFEKEDILNILDIDETNIIIAPNIPAVNNFEIMYPDFKGTLEIVFISRVSPKKNLLFAIKTLLNIDKHIRFKIYGLVSDKEYWEKCENLISSIENDKVIIEYKGAVNNNNVPEILSKSHLFFLPTHGENYGHAIAESFLAGIPVLISDQTPWRNLASHGVGWDVSLENEDEFTTIINNFYTRLDGGAKIDSSKIKEWFLKEINFEETVDNNIKMFHSLCKC